jgi:hypothetical protein
MKGWFFGALKTYFTALKPQSSLVEKELQE